MNQSNNDKRNKLILIRASLFLFPNQIETVSEFFLCHNIIKAIKHNSLMRNKLTKLKLLVLKYQEIFFKNVRKYLIFISIFVLKFQQNL